MSIQSDANFMGSPFGWGGGGFGGGFNAGLGGLGLVGLIGLNSLGRDGDRRCCDDNGSLNSSVLGASILGKLGDIEGAVPLAASQIQNSLLDQTGTLSNTINQSGLANLAATASLKDTVQASTTGILLNQNSNTQSILGAICNLGSKIDQNTITQLQTDLLESRAAGRSKDVEINVSQNVNQQQAQLQAQAQQQQQFSALFSALNALVGDIQAVKQGQVIFNSGTMAASGTQAAANTKVA
jgi:hypothetical protein